VGTSVTAPVQVPQTAPTARRELTAAQMARIVALLVAQAKIRQQMTQTAVNAALLPLRTFTGWWDAGDVSKMIGRILRTVQPAQLRAARATDAFAAQVLTVLTGRTVRPVGAIDVTRLRRTIPPEVAEDLVHGRRDPAWLELGDLRHGPNAHVNDPVAFAVHDRERRTSVAPEEVYGRAADTYRYNVVANGDSPEVAAQKAGVRVAAAAATDVTLAVREQYRAAFDRERVEGWRRIVRPEMSQTGPCGLCVVAADRVYKRADLLPLHNRCVCDVLPIVDGLDPGLRLNHDDLQAVYNAAGGTGAGGLLNVRVALAEHGELGPVLVNANQSHRGPREVAQMLVPERPVRARAQLASLEKTLATLEERAARGELKDDRALRWQRGKVAELRAEVGAA
jgi:hypothetical protein